jgi:hypothetical protein
MIIVEYFSDRDLYAFILEDRKGNELGTYDSEDDKENRPLHEGLCSLKRMTSKEKKNSRILIQEIEH